MTLVGLASRRQSMKRRNEKLAAAFPNGVRCQKCLQMGHWSYECKEKRKYLHRTSRTKQLSKYTDKKADLALNMSKKAENAEVAAKRVKKSSSSSESSSDSDSDSSSDDDSSTSSSSSDSSSTSSSSSTLSSSFSGDPSSDPLGDSSSLSD